MKFSRKLLGKRVRSHINIKSVILNVQCILGPYGVSQPRTRMLAVAYESSGQRPCHRLLRKVIPDHLQSCASATLLDCWWLTVVFILSTILRNCNGDYLRTLPIKFLNSAPTSVMPWFYLSTGWRSSSPRMQRKTGYTPLQWLYCEAWMATKLARSWLSCVGCHAESLSQAGQVSHHQSRSFKQDWRWSRMTFLRNL